MARQMFRRALRLRLIRENPFDGVKAGTERNPDRKAFITQEMTARVLEACPDAEWRLIVVLARYGGLRCPSELLALTWQDVLWDQRRLRVTSPKTSTRARRNG